MFVLAETVNPCSLDVRKALLDKVDLSSVATFSRKVGPLPDPADIQLGAQSLNIFDHYIHLITSARSRLLTEYYVSFQMVNLCSSSKRWVIRECTCIIQTMVVCLLRYVLKGILHSLTLCNAFIIFIICIMFVNVHSHLHHSHHSYIFYMFLQGISFKSCARLVWLL